MLNEIESLLQKFSEDSLFQEYYFIGGTALAYYLNHRISYDIDFIKSEKLDAQRLKELSILYDAKYVPDPKASAFKVNTGEALENYKMSFDFDGIKVEFFYPNDPVKTAIVKRDYKESCQIYPNIYILPLKTIAELKLLAFFERSKIRDLFDLYVLLEKSVIDTGVIERYTALKKETLTFPEVIETFHDDGSESLDFMPENLYYNEYRDISAYEKEGYIKEKLTELFVKKTAEERDL